MSQSQIDPNLPPELEVIIQQKMTEAVQLELGVQRSTIIALEKRIEVFLMQRVHDLELIEALKKRAFAAEDKLREVAEENVLLKQRPVKTKRIVS